MTEMVMLQIMSAECQGVEETDIGERIKQCMRRTYQHWMATDEDLQFRGALAGAMGLSDDDDKQRITDALKPLQALSAMMSGVPVDLEAVTAQLDMDNLVPLRKLWEEVKKETSDKRTSEKEKSENG